MAYSMVELNQVAFRRDGRIEAQLPFDGGDGVVAENGMLLKVDYATKKITLPTSPAAGDIFALNYSSEHMHDERTPGLENFCINKGEYPRVGFLSIGDRFTTNAITGTATVGAKVYPQASGKWGTTAVQNTPVCKVVENDTTMPNGAPAWKLVVASV